MLWAALFVLIGLFVLCVGYFELTGPIMQIINIMQENGAPEWIMDILKLGYHGFYIIVAIGLIVYLIISATSEEPDTYRM
ncbi:hypothetical protein MSHOH_2162 [Methanosarcina horonobensis HB-1 = JCM 15518]|uniref:Uncharacterized protein n=1 Tax=Methanosarcina horonobensis HB-1 = JCM 15518 TaxID=1434110 RepID=A0A0E3WU18_9EURY|nr:hypothetical protein [Methanosarcina horonobensis]AKB78645.1 hypothetical protein MSHOH_2162 [Methanosarcina horonobensis HB-1 = JCM 15518]